MALEILISCVQSPHCKYKSSLNLSLEQVISFATLATERKKKKKKVEGARDLWLIYTQRGWLQE